jgi:hypothetical protein
MLKRGFAELSNGLQTRCSEIFEAKFVRGRHLLAGTTERAMPEAGDT